MSCTVCLVAAVLICPCHMDLMRLFQSSGAATAAVLKCIEEAAARGLVKQALVMSGAHAAPLLPLLTGLGAGSCFPCLCERCRFCLPSRA
jgi:hypothetical protein